MGENEQQLLTYPFPLVSLFEWAEWPLCPSCEKTGVNLEKPNPWADLCKVTAVIREADIF